MSNVVIIGASGHGKVVADIVNKSGDKLLGFLDDDLSLGYEFCGYPIMGSVSDYDKVIGASFVIAIGNPEIRERISQSIKAPFYTAIHPSAQISGIDVVIGEGTVVMPGAIINSGAKIGRHCIINSAAVVEHDNLIADFVHVSVGAHMAGTVTVGARTMLGVGSAVKNNVSITGDCTIGAGAVVVDNIEESGTYVGVPAKKVI